MNVLVIFMKNFTLVSDLEANVFFLFSFFVFILYLFVAKFFSFDMKKNSSSAADTHNSFWYYKQVKGMILNENLVLWK